VFFPFFFPAPDFASAPTKKPPTRRFSIWPFFLFQRCPDLSGVLFVPAIAVLLATPPLRPVPDSFHTLMCHGPPHSATSVSKTLCYWAPTVDFGRHCLSFFMTACFAMARLASISLKGQGALCLQLQFLLVGFICCPFGFFLFGVFFTAHRRRLPHGALCFPLPRQFFVFHRPKKCFCLNSHRQIGLLKEPPPPNLSKWSTFPPHHIKF